MSRRSYPVVENGHIVPTVFQKPWVVDGRVKVHEVGVDRPCRLRPLSKAGTRPAPYRRERPSGEQIDDVEASLNFVEDKAAAPLRDLNEGAPLTKERKGALAQFVGVQLVRGEAFFAERDRVGEILLDIPDGALKPRLLAEAGGDPDRARALLVEKYSTSAEALMTMLRYGGKLGGILGSMRWQVIRFQKPRLVYSDHPVVVWPLGVPETQPFKSQKSGPHQTLEVRVPLGPAVGLLMNWIDQEDDDSMEATPTIAAEFNAFTVAQAEKEWMHRPGREPTIPWRSFSPLSRLIQTGYGRDYVLRTRRFAAAKQFAASVSHRKFAKEIQVI
jgi:Protein of unknown function (DUF4238)